MHKKIQSAIQYFGMSLASLGGEQDKSKCGRNVSYTDFRAYMDALPYANSCVIVDEGGIDGCMVSVRLYLCESVKVENERTIGMLYESSDLCLLKCLVGVHLFLSFFLTRALSLFLHPPTQFNHYNRCSH